MKVQCKETSVIYVVCRKKVLGSSALWQLCTEDHRVQKIINWVKDQSKYDVIEA